MKDKHEAWSHILQTLFHYGLMHFGEGELDDDIIQINEIIKLYTPKPLITYIYTIDIHESEERYMNKCPSCTQIDIKPWWNHCPNCGQAIDREKPQPKLIKYHIEGWKDFKWWKD